MSHQKISSFDDDLLVVIRCPFVSVTINFFFRLRWRFINRVSLWPDTHCVSFEEDKHWGPKGQGCLDGLHAGIFTHPTHSQIQCVCTMWRKTKHTVEKSQTNATKTTCVPHCVGRVSGILKTNQTEIECFNLGSWLYIALWMWNLLAH